IRVPLLNCQEKLQRFRRLSPVVKLASQKGGGVGPQARELRLSSQLALGFKITPPNRAAESVSPFVRVRQSKHGPQVIKSQLLPSADEPIIEGVRQVVLNAACLNSLRRLSRIEREHVDPVFPKGLLVSGILSFKKLDFFGLNPNLFQRGDHLQVRPQA